MSDFKGTPGPWFIKPVPNCTMEGAVNVIQTHNNNGLGFHIAYAYRWIDDKETKAEADANARILAAAPELLEALQEMLAIVKKHTYPQPDKPSSTWGRMEAAEAVVAKALGQ